MNKLKRYLTLICIIAFFCNSLPVHATDFAAEAESRKDMPIESNMIENWPAGPKIGAQSAILLETTTGVPLYEKNVHDKLYPASVTKILTALIAVEKCDMDEMVTFSYDAVNSIDWRTDANMGINAGDSITMEQCLYGLLVGSANEAAYAIAEHISGNVEDFAKLMNQKAAELGCVDSNFVTPNGIHDDNHYTSAYDLALIASAFFDNETLCRMSSTTSYTVPQTSTQPNPEMTVYAKSKLFPGKEYAYDGLVGTKTGYTDYARQTLVSCAKKNGMKLICVILKEESPAQYTDTLDLFEYGFNNFEMINISNNDDYYSIDSIDSFASNIDLFGSGKPLMQISSDDFIILPVGADFENASSSISYDNLDSDTIAQINYYYNDVFVGCGHLIPSSSVNESYDFGSNLSLDDESDVDNEKIVVINVIKVFLILLAIAAGLSFIFILHSLLNNSKRHRRHLKSTKNYELNKQNITFLTTKKRR